MGLFGSDDGGDADAHMRKQHQHEREQAAEQAALRQASEQAVHANPQFLAQLQDSDLNSDEFPDLESVLGPLTSGANILGNRDESYERMARWTNIAQARRIIKERSPGRIAAGKTLTVPDGNGGARKMKPLLELYHRTAGDNSRTAPGPWSVADRRAVKSAMDAITNQQTLSVDSRGLRSLTEATAVTRTEGPRDSDGGIASKSAKLFD